MMILILGILWVGVNMSRQSCINLLDFLRHLGVDKMRRFILLFYFCKGSKARPDFSRVGAQGMTTVGPE